MGEALAVELSACGIRYDFAPCVDVDTNPKNPVIGDRSFGDDPELVGRLGAAMIAGPAGRRRRRLRQALPGARRHRRRLAPRPAGGRPLALAARGRGAAALPDGDRGGRRERHDRRTCSCARSTTRGRRRSRRWSSAACCGRTSAATGVVVTDDLEMKAVAARCTPAQIAVLAAQAGCDLLAFCKTHDAQVEAIEALIRACESGEIPFKDGRGVGGPGARAQGALPRGLRRSRPAAGPATRRAVAHAPCARRRDRRALRHRGVT